MSFELHSVGTVDLGGGIGLVTLVVEVEGGKAWVSAIGDGRDTSFERVYYSDGKWGHMEIDPRGGWPRHFPMTVEEAARDLLLHLGFMIIYVTDDIVGTLAVALDQSVPDMEAAIVMYS